MRLRGSPRLRRLVFHSAHHSCTRSLLAPPSSPYFFCQYNRALFSYSGVGALNWLGDTFRASAVCLPLTPSAYFFPDRERCCRAGGTARGIIFQYPALFRCIFSSLSPFVCCPLNTELFCYIDKETLNWQGDTLLFFFVSSLMHLSMDISSLSSPHPYILARYTELR